MDDTGSVLSGLAPEVDTPAALERFRVRRRKDRRRRRIGAAVVLLAVVGIAALGAGAMADDSTTTVVADDGEPSADAAQLLRPDQDYVVLGIRQADSEPIGSLRSAVSQFEVDELWKAVGFDSLVHLNGDKVVLSLTIADDACPPELASFRLEDRLLTPVFEEPGTECLQPLIARTFVVALRSVGLSPSFTLRLPTEFTEDRERRLQVDLSPSPPRSTTSTSTTTTSLPPGAVVHPDGSIEITSSSPEEHTEAYKDLLGVEGDLVPVAGTIEEFSDGSALEMLGYVRWDAYNDSSTLAPIVNKQGDTIGYWGHSLGWLTPDEVNAPGFDYDAEVAAARARHEREERQR